MSLEEATARAPELNASEEELWQIVKSIDQRPGQQPEFELVASSICWAAGADSADVKLRMVLAHSLGRSLLQAGQLDEAEKMLGLVETQVRERGDREALAGLLGTQATLSLRRGQPDRALSHYKESFSLAEEFENRHGSAASAYGIASILKDQGKATEALSWLRRSRAIYQSVGDRFWEFQCLRNINDLLKSEGGNKERIDSLVDAVSLGAAMQARASELLPLMASLAVQRINSGQYVDANDELQAGLKLARESGERLLEGFFIGNLGSVHAMTNRLPEARVCLESALEIAVEVGDREGAETAATNLHRLSTKAAVEGNAPAVAFDEAVSAGEPLGTPASETTPDVPLSASEGDVRFPTAIRPDMYMPVVESNVAHPPRGWDPEKWAKELARLMASFQFGNAEQLADAVGDSPALLHVLQEVVACILRQEPSLESVVMPKVQPLLPPAADPDRIAREYDRLAGLAERIVLHSEEAGSILDSIDETELSRNDITAVATRVMERAAQEEDDNPLLSYMLALALSRWLSPYSAATDKFQVYQRVANLATAFRQVDMAIGAYRVACDTAREGSLQAEFAAAATNFATLLRRTGRTMEAVTVYDAAIDSLADGSRSDVAGIVLTNAATAYSDLGQYERARELSERAIRLLGDHKEQQSTLAIAYTNLSGALSGLQDMEAAEAATLSALNIARREGMKGQEAVALGHLGLFRLRQGRMSIGLRYLQTAAKDAEALHDWWNAQNWHRDIGNYFQSLDLLDESVPHFNRALELSRKIGDRRSEGICLLGLGAAKGGDNRAEGRKLLQQAWDIFIETGNFYFAVEASRHIAADLLEQAMDLDGIKHALMDATAIEAFNPGTVKDAKAMSEARQWISRAKEMLAQRGMSPDGRLATLEAAYLRLDGSPEKAAEVLREAIKFKTSLMSYCTTNLALASLLFHDLDQPKDALYHYEQAFTGYDSVADDLEWDERRVRFRDSFYLHYGKAVECALLADNIDLAFHFCERARLAELRRLWKLRGKDVPVISLNDLSAALANREGTVLIEFLPTTGKTIVFIASSHRNDHPRAITIDGFGHETLWRIWLAERKAYDQAKSPIAAFDQSLRDNWNAAIQSACDQIGSQLLAPIAAAIADLDARHIIFVPHSILHCFPLHAARLGNECWIDRYDVSYLPSASAVVHTSTLPAAGTRRFVGFADSMQDLPMARIEVERVARHFSNSPATYNGTEVTHEHVISSIANANVIHFACHAKQVLGDSLSTSIYLHDKDETDRFGAALDLYTLNRDVILQDGTVVVLSACESGMVSPRLSGEVVSLAGGFLTAGANIVISSLWKVRDACAALLVDRFYENLVEGQMQPGAALKNAQLYLRSMTEDDAYAALERMLEASCFGNRESRDSLLQQYKNRRQDVFPFSRSAEWAAFCVTGIE
jgi:CHAT domain-containing protein